MIVTEHGDNVNRVIGQKSLVLSRARSPLAWKSSLKHVRQIFAVKVARGGGITKQVFSAQQRAIRMNSVVNVFQLSKCTRRCSATWLRK